MVGYLQVSQTPPAPCSIVASSSRSITLAPPGIYKAIARAGDARREQFVIVDPEGSASTIEFEPLCFQSPAPIRATAAFSAKQLEDIELAAVWRASPPNDARLVLSLHSPDPTVPVVLPFHGYSLRSAADELVTSLDELATEERERPSLALQLDLAPGHYRLRVERDARTVEIPVFVAPAYQTFLFLHADTPCDLSAHAWMMLPAGEHFSSSDPQLRLTEIARHALIGSRNAFEYAQIRDMLGTPIQPALALLCAQMILQDSNPEWDVFDALMERLEPTFGADFPDLLALRLASAERQGTKLPDLPAGKTDFPPLLSASWSTLIAQAALFPRGSMLRSLAMACEPQGLWMAWTPGVETEVSDGWARLSTVFSLFREESRAVAEFHSVASPASVMQFASALGRELRLIRATRERVWQAQKLALFDTSRAIVQDGIAFCAEVPIVAQTAKVTTALLELPVLRQAEPLLTRISDAVPDDYSTTLKLLEGLLQQLPWEGIFKVLSDEKRAAELIAELTPIQRSLIPILHQAAKYAHSQTPTAEQLEALRVALAVPLPVLRDAVADLANKAVTGVALRADAYALRPKTLGVRTVAQAVLLRHEASRSTKRSESAMFELDTRASVVREVAREPPEASPLTIRRILDRVENSYWEERRVRAIFRLRSQSRPEQERLIQALRDLEHQTLDMVPAAVECRVTLLETAELEEEGTDEIVLGPLVLDCVHYGARTTFVAELLRYTNGSLEGVLVHALGYPGTSDEPTLVRWMVDACVDETPRNLRPLNEAHRNEGWFELSELLAANVEATRKSRDRLTSDDPNDESSPHLPGRLPDEQVWIQRATDLKRARELRRSSHPPQHEEHAAGFGAGRVLLRTAFVVRTDIPREFDRGVFTPGTTRAGWIRLSLPASTAWFEDALDESRFAIKLDDVAPGHDQDFMLGTRFAPRDVRDYALLQHALDVTDTPERALRLIMLGLRRPRKTWSLLRSLVPLPANPLDLEYQSNHASALGKFGAVKYLVRRPESRTTRLVDEVAELAELALRELPRTVTGLAWQTLRCALRRPQVLEFCLVCPTRPYPVEDDSIDWRERGAGVVPIAALVIEPQRFLSDERSELSQRLVFSPWNTLEEHQPLGSFSRLSLALEGREQRALASRVVGKRRAVEVA